MLLSGYCLALTNPPRIEFCICTIEIYFLADTQHKPILLIEWGSVVEALCVVPSSPSPPWTIMPVMVYVSQEHTNGFAGVSYCVVL